MSAFFVSRWKCVHCGMKKSSDSYLLLRFLEHCACACCVLFVSRNRYPSTITIEISPTVYVSMFQYTLRMRDLHGCPGNTALG